MCQGPEQETVWVESPSGRRGGGRGSARSGRVCEPWKEEEIVFQAGSFVKTLRRRNMRFFQLLYVNRSADQLAGVWRHLTPN